MQYCLSSGRQYRFFLVSEWISVHPENGCTPIPVPPIIATALPALLDYEFIFLSCPKPHLGCCISPFIELFLRLYYSPITLIDTDRIDIRKRIIYVTVVSSKPKPLRIPPDEYLEPVGDHIGFLECAVLDIREDGAVLDIIAIEDEIRADAYALWIIDDAIGLLSIHIII